jgi:Double-GTPase 2/Sporulation and spore germination
MLAWPGGRVLRAGVLSAALAGVSALTSPATAALASTPTPVLTAIDATHHRTYDRLVFQFAQGLPARHSARFVSQLPLSSSGSPVSIVGRALLLVSFSEASGGQSGKVAYGPARRSYDLPGVIQVVTVRDDQQVIKLGVGLARREPFRMLVRAHASQVIIDVQTPYRTVTARDYFVDPGGTFGTPILAAAGRPTITRGTASRVLQRLFAGPTQAERARGLRLITSGATGFTLLTIRHGVARVHLTGSCHGGGSVTTVATEIMPTLRQFPTVRWVKIYSPAGHTQFPDGSVDSIPACLTATPASVWIAQHGWPGLAVLALAVGLAVLLGVVLTGFSLVSSLARRPNLITPLAYRAERVKAKPAATGQFDPDLAWPFYPLRQARADLGQFGAEQGARFGKLWKWPGPPILWFVFFPVSAVVAAFVGLVILTMIVLTMLFDLVTWTCAGIAVVVFAPGVIAARGAEGAWRKRVRAEASCPHCYHVMPRPAYRCPGCQKLHRDVRPGRLGLVARRCECGKLLPTMVVRASRRLPAACQRCGKPLRRGSGVFRDVRIPIFGDTSAGKTRFLYAGLDSLLEATQRDHIPFGFPDQESQNQASLAFDLIRSGQDTVKTSRTLPTALTCRIGAGPGSTLAHLFDAAGEDYHDAQLHDSLGFLDRGHGLVYVLDPFSIGVVRDRVAGQKAVGLANAAAGDPETAYGEVVSRLRDSGVEASGQRLAVVVSKADLLSAGGIELPEDSAAIKDWLMQAGVHNLVLSAGREFAEVRYFTVASVAAAHRRSHDPGAPLHWLLASRGATVPAEAVRS